jgi:hypothetical protein
MLAANMKGWWRRRRTKGISRKMESTASSSSSSQVSSVHALSLSDFLLREGITKAAGNGSSQHYYKESEQP